MDFSDILTKRVKHGKSIVITYGLVLDDFLSLCSNINADINSVALKCYC